MIGVITIALITISCTTPNPNAGQPITSISPTTGLPVTTPAPAYIPDPRIAGASNAVVAATEALAPINPWAGLTQLAIPLIFGIWGAAATKSSLTKSSTINALATSVAAQGPTIAQAILDHASNAEATYPAVVTAINAKLPPDPITLAKTS